MLSVLTLLGAAFILPTGSAGAAQRATETGTPIKIGYLMTNTGPANITEAPAFDATIKYINAHGGVGGHPIQLIVDTETNDVAVSVTNAQKFISQGVDAVVDGDANDSAWASDMENAGIPVFLSADTLAFGSSDDAFGSPQTPTVTTPLEMLALNKFKNVNKIGVLYCTEYAQCSQAVPYYTSIGKKYGDDVVYSAAASQSAPNYLAQCLAAKAAGAESLFPATSSDVSVRVVENCAKQGYTPHLLAGSGSYQKSFVGDHWYERDDRHRSQRSVLRHEQLTNQYHDGRLQQVRPGPHEVAVLRRRGRVELDQRRPNGPGSQGGALDLDHAGHRSVAEERAVGTGYDDRRRPDGARDVRRGEARGQQLRLHGLHQEQQVHPPVRAEGHLPPVELSISRCQGAAKQVT